MLLLFAFTLFVSSCLLFLLEPMFGKMVLPLLGGTPAVWNTCMVFFQVALLGGYAYAHISATRLRLRRQLLLHVALAALALVVLPIRIGAGLYPPTEASPIPWLLLLLLSAVGLPFFVLSATSAMMQAWFSHSSHRQAKDPYFLYAASNLGSVTGLIGYLAVVEPNLALTQQASAWTVGYVLLIAITVACAILTWRAGDWKKDVVEPEQTDAEAVQTDDRAEAITLWRRLRWITLAFAPSSLMLGVTTYLTTDIAAVPMLWVAPLTLYLLTFVVAFSRRSYTPHALLKAVFPILVVIKILVLPAIGLPRWWLHPVVNLTLFAVAAAICHRELANDRPPARHLTQFYLLLAVGGALGGVFNVIIAPTIFTSIAEYPLVLVLVCLLIARPLQRQAATATGAEGARRAFEIRDIIWPIAVALMIPLLLQVGSCMAPYHMPKIHKLTTVFAGLLCCAMIRRPIRIGIALAAMLILMAVGRTPSTRILYQERNFFGVLRVETGPNEQLHIMNNGTTLHGMQRVSGYTGTPLAYYYPTSPIGQLFSALGDDSGQKDVALIGLGVGALTAYAKSGQNFTYYEINPAVRRVALDPSYFTHLDDASGRGANIRIVLGDGRVTLRSAPDRTYDLLVLDAFSSDAIPVHLLTRQAMRMYFTKLKDHGFVAVHITNKFLRLEPVIAKLAGDAGLVCLSNEELRLTTFDVRDGKLPSHWALLARQPEDFGEVRHSPSWKVVKASPTQRVWTDDYSNVLAAIRWR